MGQISLLKVTGATYHEAAVPCTFISLCVSVLQITVLVLQPAALLQLYY